MQLLTAQVDWDNPIDPGIMWVSDNPKTVMKSIEVSNTTDIPIEITIKRLDEQNNAYQVLTAIIESNDYAVFHAGLSVALGVGHKLIAEADDEDISITANLVVL